MIGTVAGLSCVGHGLDCRDEHKGRARTGYVSELWTTKDRNKQKYTAPLYYSKTVPVTAGFEKPGTKFASIRDIASLSW